MKRSEPVGKCGCQLVRDQDGLRMIDCPLHAAAPDLLEACKVLVSEWHRTHKGGHLMKFVPRDIIDAENAINNAEGR